MDIRIIAYWVILVAVLLILGTYILRRNANYFRRRISPLGRVAAAVVNLRKKNPQFRETAVEIWLVIQQEGDLLTVDEIVRLYHGLVSLVQGSVWDGVPYERVLTNYTALHQRVMANPPLVPLLTLIPLPQLAQDGFDPLQALQAIQ